MTRFEDGPAKGQVLMLKRAPRFLRVVQSQKSGAWDALNELMDTPQPEEKLFAYESVGQPAYAFVDGTKCHGCYAIAAYRFISEQPPDAVMRNSDIWGAWCESRVLPKSEEKE